MRKIFVFISIFTIVIACWKCQPSKQRDNVSELTQTNKEIIIAYKAPCFTDKRHVSIQVLNSGMHIIRLYWTHY